MNRRRVSGRLAYLMIPVFIAVSIGASFAGGFSWTVGLAGVLLGSALLWAGIEADQ